MEPENATVQRPSSCGRRESALLIMSAPTPGWQIPLAEVTRIGRDADNHIVLADRQVSRHHAVVRHTEQGYVLEDLQSKNGTFVRGRRVSQPVRLEDGDELIIAARYKFHFVDADATAPLVFEGRGLRIDTESMTVYVNGQPVQPPLSASQYELLLMLYQAMGHVVPREEIVSRVWAEDEAQGVSEEAIDALTRRLRLRLAEIDPDHNYIVTVRGYGYRLDNPA